MTKITISDVEKNNIEVDAISGFITMLQMDIKADIERIKFRANFLKPYIEKGKNYDEFKKYHYKLHNQIVINMEKNHEKLETWRSKLELGKSDISIIEIEIPDIPDISITSKTRSKIPNVSTTSKSRRTSTKKTS